MPLTPSTGTPVSQLPVATAIGANDRAVVLRPNEPLDTNKLVTVPVSLLGSASETAAMVKANATARELTYEAPKNLSSAQVDTLGLAVVTASGTTHDTLANIQANYDSQTGALVIELPGSTAPADVLAVHLYRVAGGQEHILSDTINPFGGGGSGLPAGTAFRDPLAIGDNTAVTAAVLDGTNTWTNGDLTAYGSAALSNAGAPAAVSGQDPSILVGSADVENGDQFDAVFGGGGWRYFYGRRNDGTSGWTRTPKG